MENGNWKLIHFWPNVNNSLCDGKEIQEEERERKRERERERERGVAYEMQKRTSFPARNYSSAKSGFCWLVM